MSETKSGLSTLFTLTPTHCGTGQAAGAVDLPIARERHTRLPVLPASALKGVARDVFERSLKANLGQRITKLFGPEISAAGTEEDHHAGLLVFCEAKLLAFPARSLQRPYLFATCPLIVERLVRDLRAFGFSATAKQLNMPKGDYVFVADRALDGQALVVEDLVYSTKEVRQAGEVETLARLLSSWLPIEETATRQRLESSLVLLPDQDFTSLVERAPPVHARIKLTGGKTTDRWTNEDGEDEKGNLWYEEVLPSDCLFAAFMTERRQRHQGTRRNQEERKQDDASWSDFWSHRSALASVQLGGNETIGYGRCWWNVVSEGVVP